MELEKFINDIYEKRVEIFHQILIEKGQENYDLKYIKNLILKTIKKNFKNTVPVIIPDNDLTKLSEKISKDFTKHTLSFFTNYEITNKFIRFLNSPLPKKIIKNGVSQEITSPVIKSNFLSTIEKILSQNIIEDYNPNKIKFLKEVLVMREFFNKNFPWQEINFEEIQNAILFSIIVNSFISFNDIIEKLNNLTLNDINLHIGILNFKNKRNQNIRFFIDYFTIFLLKILILNSNLHKLSVKNKKSKKIFNLKKDSFNKWLKDLHLKATGINSESPDILNLLKIAGVLSSFIFPPSIVALLKRKLDYTSFDISIIERVNNQKYKKVDYKKFKSPKVKIIKQPSSTSLKDLKKETKILHKIFSILDKNKKHSENLKIINNQLKKIDIENYSVSFNLLIEWLIYNLSKKNKRLKVSTIKEYFSGFYKDFLEITYELSLFELDEDEIEEIIEQLFLKRFYKIYYNYIEIENITIEDINLNKSIEGKSVGKIKAKIKNFFLFYKNKYNPNLTDEIFYSLEFYRSKSSVRTSLITPGEFKLFLKTLEHPRKDFIKIIAGLAFYAGLRKSEILNLKFKDIVFGVEDYIFIQKSKTYSGRRKILIHYLFPDYFLNDLKTFYIENINSLKKLKIKQVNNLKLFDNKIYKKEFFLEDINFLIFSLKKFFNDEKLVFHSLRHCFGSWLILNFFIITRPKFEKYLLKLFKNKELLGINLYNRDKLKNFFKSKNTKLYPFGLWKISMTIGHISPEETLSNYIHVLELYTGYFNWIISQKIENLYRFYGKFNSKRIILLIKRLNSDRSVRKARFSRFKNSYSMIDIMRYLDKYLKIKSIF